MSSGGFIYAIGAEGTLLVKIGFAKSVEKRLSALQTGQSYSWPNRLHEGQPSLETHLTARDAHLAAMHQTLRRV